jgi:hypothetical protein
MHVMGLYKRKEEARNIVLQTEGVLESWLGLPCHLAWRGWHEQREALPSQASQFYSLKVLRGCLVLLVFLTPIKSNVWTYVWSIKHRLIIKLIAQIEINLRAN